MHFYHEEDKLTVFNIISFWYNSYKPDRKIPIDIVSLIFEFLRKYYSSLSNKFVSSLITLLNNDTMARVGFNEYGVCRFQHPLLPNTISIWYVNVDFNDEILELLDGGNCFGVISNHDTSTKHKSGRELFPGEIDDIYLGTKSFYGIALSGYLNHDWIHSQLDENWLQHEYSNHTQALTFRIECDLRSDREYITVYDLNGDKELKIGYKHLDYTLKLPFAKENEIKYIWYPCIAPWGPSQMTIYF